MADHIVTLSALFSRALASASKAFSLPTIEDSTQDLIRASLNDLRQLNSRLTSISLFSPNESLEDISSRDLVYLLVSYVLAEVLGRVRTTNTDERISIIRQSQVHLQTFLEHLENYAIVPESERSLHEQKSSAISNPNQRREVKIKQYKLEKELRNRVQAIRKRRRQHSLNEESSSEFDLISSLLPSPSTGSSATADDEDSDSETDDIVRETTLLIIRLTYAQTHTHLESLSQELELLRSAPLQPSPTQESSDDPRTRATGQDDTWRLDPLETLNSQGSLLDLSGKPLRPFTILPSSATERTRLQSQVFGPGHRLPTMSVDEYLEIERQRGKFVSGGGAASAAAPTSSEQLALDAEADGTLYGEQKAEEKRLKDEEWAQYTDLNPKGAGNTMNRG